MIPQFTLQLIFGMALTWCIAPRPQITSGFFRIQMLVTLGLSVLTLLTLSQLESIGTVDPQLAWLMTGGGLALTTISFLGSVLWTLERRAGGTWCAGAIMLVAAMLVLIVSGVPPAPDVLTRFHQAGTSLSAGWLIGGTTSAMLLGHWYLTATGMPLGPLVRLNQWFAISAVVRIIFSGWAAVVADWNQLNTVTASWVVLRWCGLLGPIVIALLVVRILKYRNTQSATGVLYAATISVFMGEMAAALLSSSGAFPLWP